MLGTESSDLRSSSGKTGRVLAMGMVTPADPTVVGSWAAAEEVVWLGAGPLSSVTAVCGDRGRMEKEFLAWRMHM